MDKTGRGGGVGAGDQWIKPGDWELGDIIMCLIPCDRSVSMVSVTFKYRPRVITVKMVCGNGA